MDCRFPDQGKGRQKVLESEWIAIHSQFVTHSVNKDMNLSKLQVMGRDREARVLQPAGREESDTVGQLNKNNNIFNHFSMICMGLISKLKTPLKALWISDFLSLVWAPLTGGEFISCTRLGLSSSINKVRQAYKFRWPNCWAHVAKERGGTELAWSNLFQS